MRKLSVGHPEDLTCVLKGVPLGGFILGELLLGGSPCCPPSSGW